MLVMQGTVTGIGHFIVAGSGMGQERTTRCKSFSAGGLIVVCSIALGWYVALFLTDLCVCGSGSRF